MARRSSDPWLVGTDPWSCQELADQWMAGPMAAPEARRIGRSDVPQVQPWVLPSTGPRAPGTTMGPYQPTMGPKIAWPWGVGVWLGLDHSITALSAVKPVGVHGGGTANVSDRMAAARGLMR